MAVQAFIPMMRSFKKDESIAYLKNALIHQNLIDEKNLWIGVYPVTQQKIFNFMNYVFKPDKAIKFITIHKNTVNFCHYKGSQFVIDEVYNIKDIKSFRYGQHKTMPYLDLFIHNQMVRLRSMVHQNATQKFFLALK